MAFKGFMPATARLVEHYPALPDVAGFAARYNAALTLDVFIPNDDGPVAYGEYDPGRDAIADSLIKQQVWEAQESTVVVDILAGTPGTVLDFGAHIGWYTVLAGRFGAHPVVAFEPYPAAITALEANAHRHGVDVALRSGVGPATPPLDVDGDIALMKCDIEGTDSYAVDCCANLFQEHRIRYALIEVSPIFTKGGPCDYVAMVGRLRDWGYHVYQTPPKGWEHNDVYREAPLVTLKRHRELGGDWAEVIADCRQDNFVFIRDEDAA